MTTLYRYGPTYIRLNTIHILATLQKLVCTQAKIQKTGYSEGASCNTEVKIQYRFRPQYRKNPYRCRPKWKKKKKYHTNSGHNTED